MLRAHLIHFALLAVLFLVQLIASAVLLGGIADQARYGPKDTCLLFISNYHQESTIYVFQARSSTCTNLIALGAGSLVLTIPVAIVSLFYASKATPKMLLPSGAVSAAAPAQLSAWMLEGKPRAVAMCLAVLASISAFMCATGAIAGWVGLAQSCREFESVPGATCAETFEHGFFHDSDPSVTYVKNMHTVAAAVTAAWVMLGTWAVTVALEWRSWVASGKSQWW
ncbi:hypothetical protein HK105_205411 [Polyrhizophydium stewartii]|uniref:Membrane-associated protein n=1 Tax=Polyrhizophydium stewartii TaxID=2732419 RepID=A0ABR4N6C1_9FUNG|nr:hypothetical protein HK105_006099 [Polyrhizophydium stewartii]